MKQELPRDEFVIQLFACILIFAGVYAAVGMVYGLFHDSFGLNFNVIGILVGKGLIERKEFWRKWGLFLAWVGIISFPVVVWFWVFGGRDFNVELFGVETGMSAPWHLVAVPSAVGAVFSVWVVNVLAKQEVKANFSSEGSRKEIWWVSVAVAAVGIFYLNYSQQVFFHTYIGSIDHYETTIHVLDAQTGETLLPGIGWKGRSLGQYFPKGGIQSAKTADGDRAMKIMWVGEPSLQIKVSSDMYHQEKNIHLTEADDGKVLRVELERKDEYKVKGKR